MFSRFILHACSRVHKHQIHIFGILDVHSSLFIEFLLALVSLCMSGVPKLLKLLFWPLRNGAFIISSCFITILQKNLQAKCLIKALSVVARWWSDKNSQTSQSVMNKFEAITIESEL